MFRPTAEALLSLIPDGLLDFERVAPEIGSIREGAEVTAIYAPIATLQTMKTGDHIFG
jgi:hypothetical protein